MKQYILTLLAVGLVFCQNYDPETGELIKDKTQEEQNYDPETGALIQTQPSPKKTTEPNTDSISKKESLPIVASEGKTKSTSLTDYNTLPFNPKFIYLKKGFLGYYFYKNGIKYSFLQLGNELKPVPEARATFQEARQMQLLSGGGGLLALLLADGAGGDSDGSAGLMLMLTGLGAVMYGTKVLENGMNEAVHIYNQEIEKLDQ